MPTSSTTVLFACALAAVGCADPAEVDVTLVHSPTLVPGDAFERLVVRVHDADSCAEVLVATLEKSQLGGRAKLFDLGRLEEGRRYRISVEADAPLCGPAGRVIGRSVPFEHGSGPYGVSVQVGCADELSETWQPSGTPHVGGLLVTTADGEALAIGGANRLSYEEPGVRVEPDWVTTLVERYDPTRGRFEPLGNVREAHISGAGIALPDGRVAAIGGFTTDGAGGVTCTSTVELLGGGAPMDGAPLATPRCWPSAVALSDRVAVVGGAVDMLNRDLDAEVFDLAMQRSLQRSVPGMAWRLSPAVVPLSGGRTALVIGGQSGDVIAERIEIGSDTGEVELRRVVVGATVLAYHNMSAAYVPCATGGGAVYITGGATVVLDPAAPKGYHQVTVDSVACYRDDGGARLDPIVLAGQLPGPRQQHVSIAVPGREGRQRLLIVGGTAADDVTEALPYTDGLIADVDGCACVPGLLQPRDFRVISNPTDGFPVGTRMTRLPDGTVLTLGAFEFAGGSEVTGTVDAAIFVPDIEPCAP